MKPPTASTGRNVLTTNDEGLLDWHIRSLVLIDPWRQPNIDWPDQPGLNLDLSKVIVCFYTRPVMNAFFAMPTYWRTAIPVSPKVDVVLPDPLDMIIVTNGVAVQEANATADTSVVMPPALQIVLETSQDFTLQIEPPDPEQTAPPRLVVKVSGGEAQIVTIGETTSEAADVTLEFVGDSAVVVVASGNPRLPGIAVPSPAEPVTGDQEPPTTKINIKSDGDLDSLAFMQPAAVNGQHMEVVLDKAVPVTFPNFVLNGYKSRFGFTLAGNPVQVTVGYGQVLARSELTQASHIAFIPVGPFPANLSVGPEASVTLIDGAELGAPFVIRTEFIRGYNIGVPIVSFDRLPVLVGTVESVTLEFVETGSVENLSSTLPTQVIVAGVSKELAEHLRSNSTAPAGYQFEIAQTGVTWEVRAVGVAKGSPTEDGLFQAGAIVGIVSGVVGLVLVIGSVLLFSLKKRGTVRVSDSYSPRFADFSDNDGSDDDI
jgi:hypothetical protein